MMMACNLLSSVGREQQGEGESNKEKEKAV
jgi:hypothetical protein